MTDFIAEFLDFLSANNCAPAYDSDIIPDDKPHYYQLAGDTGAQKRGSYCLKIDGEIAVAWVRNHRYGESYSYFGKPDKQWTAEQKAEFKKRIEVEKRAREKQEAEAHTQAAIESKTRWDSATPAIKHAYLTKKQVKSHGLRVLGNDLLVPMYADNKLWGFQVITPDGDKFFGYRDATGKITGGCRKKGCYFPLATKDEDKSVILLAEGYSTAASIREATNLPTIVCYDAGNLKPVAVSLKKKYPESRFVICADNDLLGKNKKQEPYNTGIEKAREAAATIKGAAVIWPELGEKECDFNDLYVQKGSEYVKERIISAIPRVEIISVGVDTESPKGLSLQYHSNTNDEHHEDDWTVEEIPLSAYEEETRELVALYAAHEPEKSDAWRTELNFNEKGKLNPRSLNNARLIMENDKVLSNLFCFDDFAKEKIVYRCPPWEDVAKFKPRTLNDTDITLLACDLEKRGIVQAPNSLQKIVTAVIKKNSRNPAKEYFENLKWDGVPRLDGWLKNYCGATFDDAEYVSLIGRKWLTAAVNRVFDPGCKFDHMLVMESTQNAGKSRLLAELATIHNVRYFDDTIKISDLGTGAVVPKLQGVLIIEIAEMSGFKKKDVDELKQAITTTVDRIVQKYENEATSYPRQFVMAGTINPLDGYLHDPTGNRRFWPVRLGDKLKVDDLKRDKEQLWAEAVVCYRAGEKLYLEDNQYEKARDAQLERNVMHAWYPELETLAREKGDVIPTQDIWDTLGISDRTKRTRAVSDDVAKIMTILGYENGRRRIEGSKPKYAWVKKIVPLVRDEQEEEVLFG